jgi:acyl-CoA reductase-like NAD-dependent aldehyde dehydrogenase
MRLPAVSALAPAVAGRDAAEVAVGAARAAQRHWAALGVPARADRLRAAACVLAADSEALVTGLVASGRPETEAWSAEIVPTLDAVRWVAAQGPGVLRPQALGRSRLQWYFRATRHRLVWEPHGVIGVVTPASSLLFLAVPQVAAALLAGNAVVWKPAPQGTAVACVVARALTCAGVPPAVMQVVPGGATVARAVVEAGVDKLHFTGGSDAGLALYRLQAEAGRPAVLELSGRHVAVVLAPCDAQVTAQGLAWGKLANRGRNCVAVQLVLVERAVAPDLLGALAVALREAAGRAPVPSVSVDEQRRVGALVADAVQRGARLAAGRPPGPMILTDVTPGMRVVDEEVQAPLLGVAVVDGAEEAVERVNAARHRLSASVWTTDVGRARRVAEQLDVGQVWINEQLQPTAQPAVALAGRGASGFGATRGVAGLMEMVQPKLISETPPRARRRHYTATAGETVRVLRATVRLARRLSGLRW